MPTPSKGIGAGPAPDGPPDPKALVDALCGGGGAGNAAKAPKNAPQADSAKAAAALHVWNLALQGPGKREELHKAGAVPPLLQLMERGDTRERYAAAGALVELLEAPAALQELAASSAAVGKVLSAACGMLRGAHARSHLPGAQLLALLATQPELLPRLEPCLPLLVQAVMPRGHAWSGQRRAQAAAADCLRALLQPSELAGPAAMEARQRAVLEAGGLRALLELAVEGSSRQALSACACLRFLAQCPAFAAAAAASGDGALLMGRLVGLLDRSSDATRSYVCGLLWELSGDAAAAQLLLGAGAVPLLLAVVRDTAHAAGAGRKKKKSSNGKKDKGGRGDGGAPSKGGEEAASADAGGPLLPQQLEADPALAARTALLTATGALHHLSFHERAKQQLGTPAAVKLVAGLLGAGADGQVYDNVVGTLWNLGTCVASREALRQAAVPTFLQPPALAARPVGA